MDEIEKLEARVREQKSRFAGWFCELNSAMSYRLWEQGGEDCDPDYPVPLYESECGLSHDEALALLAVVREAKEAHRVMAELLPNEPETYALELAFDALEQT